MRIVRVSKPRKEKDLKDEFELMLEEDGMTAEEEAFIRGWEQGNY